MSKRQRLAMIGVLAWAATAWAGDMATVRIGKAPGAAVEVPRPTKDTTPTAYVARTGTPPTLDGKIDEDAWKAAQIIHIGWTLDGSAVANQDTEVRLLRDANNLYIAYRCLEPFVGKIRAGVKGNDEDPWNDDSVEMFFGTDEDDDYYHVIVNSLPTVYDGFNKDKGPDIGVRAAAAVGAGAWTAEMAIPLDKIKIGGKRPTKWIANWVRNRYTRGRWEELAWSPTFSGDSHVPKRFGTVLFADVPAEILAAQQPKALPKGLTLLKTAGGDGVVRFSLSAVPAGAKVLRAELLMFRTGAVTGLDDEALVDPAIVRLAEPIKDGGKPAPAGGPLALPGPWYDRFDATDAVRAARRAGSVDFLVKAFPLWNAEATCLDVAVAGKPKAAPPAVTGLRVLHRSGQTFITWMEIEDVLGKARCRWGELRGVLGKIDNKRQVRYAVYRGDKPITAKTLDAAERIAIVAPLSCWNVNGRNIEQPIDEALTRYALIHHQWNPFVNASVDGPYGLDCRMQRLVIDETPDGAPAKPLPAGSGLYVHTTKQKGKFYYAVVTCIDGVQNTAALSAANSLAKPVAESPADPKPVLQGVLPPRPYWDYKEDRRHYVRWVAPPLGNLPCQYYNWAVAVPRKGARGAAMELSLHRDGHAYYRTQYRIDRSSVVVIPHDFPLRTWWFGYHESQGTLRSFRQGAVHPYTERRILSFMDWVAARWPVDRSRTIVTGMNDGAAAAARRLKARYPKVFARCVARSRGRGGYARSMEPLWGKAAWRLKTPDGKSVWSEAGRR